MSVPTDDSAGPGPVPRVRALRAADFTEAKKQLSWIERMNIALIGKTFDWHWLDRVLLLLQRAIGRVWVDHCTKYLRHVYGLERLPPLTEPRSFVVVSNHRSFFDMFVIDAVLLKHGFRQRMLFPVRSNFFYDHPLGFLVNGIMSFWSMYPPIFRDRRRLALNHAAMSELGRNLDSGGRSAGIHPEGTRNKGHDPYTLLPAQSGVGRLIHVTNAMVIPVFINGLGNDLVKQVASNFTKKGEKIVVVFGEPISFADLRKEAPTSRTFRAIAERTLEQIAALGDEERAHRAQLTPTRASHEPSTSQPG